MTYPCPCCGYLTSAGPGSDDICPICFWQDDITQLRFPETSGGANHVSLIQGQANFLAIGACEERLIRFVRSPLADEPRDPLWRPIDPAIDSIESPTPGFDYGTTYPNHYIDLYYWRPSYWRRRRR